MVHVRALAQRPHPIGSADHARVQAYLIATLTSLGLEPQVQRTTGVATRNSVAARVENVLVRVPGRQPGGPAVLLVAHYDGVPAGPAAGDDAAAVAAILETLRALRSSPPLAHDVVALLSDGEESGLTGAAAFVREHPWAKDIAVVLNFEGRGTAGPVQMFETGDENLDAVRVLRSAPDATGTSLSVTIYRAFAPNDTDMSELARLAQPGLNFAFLDGAARYHTPSDEVARLEPGSVQHHGELALSLTKAFADGPLPRPRAGDAVFFSVPGLGMVVYPQGLALPLAIATTALVLAACLLLRRRQLRWVRDLALGSAGTLAATILGVLVAWGLSRIAERLTGGTQLWMWPGSSGVYGAALALVALAVAAACWILVRRWASARGAHVGALLVWAAVLLLATRKLPGASFLLLWPLLAACIAALVALSAVQNRVAQGATWAATIVGASIIVPTSYGIAIVGLTMVGPAPVMVGLAVPLFAWLVAPHVEAFTAPHRWLAAVALCVAGMMLLAFDLANIQPTGAQPEGSMLGYAIDADSAGSAWLVTRPEYARRGSWAWDALGPGGRLVRPRMPVAAGAPPVWLTRALGGESSTLVRAVSRMEVPGPEIRVATDSATPEGRRIELRVRPAPGTQSIRLWAIDSDILAAAVDGRTIDPTHYRRRPPPWTLGYVAPPPEGFTLALTVPAGRPLLLDAIARSLGLPPAITGIVPQRPNGVVPIHEGDQTVVRRRVRF